MVIADVIRVLFRRQSRCSSDDEHGGDTGDGPVPGIWGDREPIEEALRVRPDRLGLDPVQPEMDP